MADEEKEELPLTVDDVEPEEKADDLLEPEPEKKPEAPVEDKPTADEVGRFAALAEAAKKEPAKPAEAPSELDVFGWQTKAVQDFRSLTDPTSAHFRATVEKIKELKLQGYPRPDLDYVAAQLAWNDPKVALDRNSERSREGARDASAGFPRPTRKPAEPAEPVLNERQEAHAKLAGITNPAVKKMLAEDLRAAARELRR